MSVLSELIKKENWLVWIKGLLSATISGGAVGVPLVIANPATYNVSQGGFANLFWVIFLSGIVGAANYIKKSPMPELEEL